MAIIFLIVFYFRNKKKYIIEFSGVFERGTVKLSLFARTKEVKLKTVSEAKKIATKFYFKSTARFYCYLLNKSAVLRTYQVNEI